MRKITLYVPCYNAEKTIKQCLDSIMKQTYEIDEIIVIDDGSTDNSVNLVRPYPVKLIINRMNKGLVYCRNICCKTAACEFVAALDSDCVAAPNWLEQLMAVIRDDSIAGAGGRVEERYAFSLPDKWRTIHMAQGWGKFILNDPPFLFGSNTVFKKEIIEKAGFYNEKLMNNYEDVEFSQRVHRLGFSLRYNPEAQVQHLRTDTIATLLCNYRKWYEQSHRSMLLCRPELERKDRILALRLGLISEHADFFKSLFREDLSKNPSLLPIDILFLLYFLWKDLKATMEVMLRIRICFRINRI